MRLRWLKANVAIFGILLLIPWLFVAGKGLRVLWSNCFDPRITATISTPSGDRFWYQNPDTAWNMIAPASADTFGYAVVNHSKSLDTQLKTDIEQAGCLWRVPYPINYCVVRKGIIGRAKDGYYIIDTAQRQVHLNLSKSDWLRQVRGLGGGASYKLHWFPLHRSHAKRGWLHYSGAQ